MPRANTALAPMTSAEFEAAQQDLTSQTWQDAVKKWTDFYNGLLESAGKTTPTWDQVFETAGGEAGATWPTLTKAMRAALQENNLETAGDPVGACVYLIGGSPVCAEMTQSECKALAGNFFEGQVCPHPA